jgi:outer membrane lipoprotein carrier protein
MNPVHPARSTVRARQFNVTPRPSQAFSVLLAAAALLPWQSPAAEPEINRVLKSVEKRYNSVKTLEADFSETYKLQGRSRTETGVLYLRKPARMRWEYRDPAGKLFISDGKDAYFYTPDNKRAEKIKLKESEDLRAPLAFLLGKLDFSREFQNFTMKPEGDKTWITALPKKDDVPYRQVQFLTSPDSRIERLIVTGQDASILDFAFTGEKTNVALNDTMFRFQLPQGAQFIDSSQSGGDR